jgi:hypothetical protein
LGIWAFLGFRGGKGLGKGLFGVILCVAFPIFRLDLELLSSFEGIGATGSKGKVLGCVLSVGFPNLRPELCIYIWLSFDIFGNSGVGNVNYFSVHLKSFNIDFILMTFGQV